MNEREIMDSVKLESMTPKKFKGAIESHRNHFETDDEYRRICVMLADGEVNARAFLEPRAVGIGEFSSMVGLPVSTVRHYVRLGLIEPWEVGGKYRFEAVNIAQVRALRQWTDLGLNLEQIVERKKAQQARQPGMLVRDVLGFAQHVSEIGKPVKIAFVRRVVHENNDAGINITEELHLFDGDLDTAYDTEAFKAREVIAELLEEHRLAREKLQERKQELERRIQKALEFEAELSGATAA
jgi:DNA-binding transcriptional MerR regulator